MPNKRGEDESGSAAATLILLIALFIIGYVLLLPEEDRRELLGEDYYKDGTSSTGSIEPIDILLATSPGDVYSSNKDEYSIKLTPARLYYKTQDNLINVADTIDMSSNLFSTTKKNYPFTLPHYDNLDKVYMFFFINKLDGDIKIQVNDYVVYEGKPTSADVPIQIPKDMLRKTNFLYISTGRGIFTKEYVLTDIYLKEVYWTENKQTRRTFELSSGEKEGIEKVELNYFVNCYKISDKEQGILSVNLNDFQLVEDHIVCDAGLQTYQISKSLLNKDTNTLTFSIDKGDYGLEDMEIAIKTRERFYPQYNFEIDDDIYEDLKNDFCEDKDRYNECFDDCAYDYDYCRERRYDDCYSDYIDCKEDCDKTYNDCSDYKLMLDMTFGDDTDRKRATLTVNKNEFSIDTTDHTYSRDISDYIQLGSNYVKIIPKTDFEITDLRIYTGQKD